MNAIKQKVFGHFIVDKHYAVLWLGEDDGMTPAVYLRYGLTLRGIETSIFPAFALDDWGQERKKLELYKWLRNEGDRFPRSEVFGFDENGKEVQHFLREIELYWKYPTYAYKTKSEPIPDGTLLTHIIVTNDAVNGVVKMEDKPPVKAPLRRARVVWAYAPAVVRPTFATTLDLLTSV